MAQRAQAEHLVGLPGGADQHARVLGAAVEQALAHEDVDGRIQPLDELLFAPADEQLLLQERIHGGAEAAHRVHRHAAVVLEAAGQPAGRGEQVQDVVAVVAQQHRGVAVDVQHVAQRVFGAGEHPDLLAVGDDLLRRVRCHRHPVGVRQLGQQGLGQGDLRGQVGHAHGVLGRGKQRQRQQVHRVHVGGAVDVDLDALGQLVDHARQPRRALVVRQRAAVPLRRALGQRLAQVDRLAEVHHHLPVVGAQHPRDRAQQLPDRFLLLGLAGQLVEVAVTLHQLLVADVDRLEQHRAGRLAQVGAHGHGDHAALGRQQPAGARAAALDEVFDRVAAGHQLRHVLAQHRRIQRAAADAAADEERPALAQQGADHRQVEVDAGHDVRRDDAAGVQQVAQQQVVHVAAVAGHVHHLVPGRGLLEPVQVVHQHAAVDAVPDEGQQEAGRAHHRVGVVGGDLVGVAVGLLPGVLQAGVVAPCLVGDGVLHRRGGQHAVHQQAAGRQVRTDHRRADAPEVGP